MSHLFIDCYAESVKSTVRDYRKVYTSDGGIDNTQGLFPA
jgi:hypothetical protein